MMRIAGIIEESIVDGPGIRVVFFMQGCLIRCLECHNPNTWNPLGGKEMSINEIEKVLDNNPYTDGITLTGGDPFFQTEASLLIACSAKRRGLNVLAYAGCVFEELLKKAESNITLKELLSNIDILIDGPFISSQRDLSLKYRGSSNQRIIDLPRSLMAKRPIEINL